MRVMKSGSYKLKIRKVILRIKRLDPGLTYQSLAKKIGVEPSYLSRFLGDSDVHFSDELLYRLLSALSLSWSEMDMIFLLKEYDRSSNPERKSFLLMRIRLGRVQRWKKLLNEMRVELKHITDILDR